MTDAKQRAASIPSVKDATGATFGGAALDHDPFPFVKPLAYEKCGIKVKAVPPSAERKDDGTPTRRGYYSLINRSTDLPIYRPGCLYAFDRRVGEIEQQFKHDIDRDGDVVVLLLRTRLPPRNPADGDPPASTDRRTETSTPSN